MEGLADLCFLHEVLHYQYMTTLVDRLRDTGALISQLSRANVALEIDLRVVELYLELNLALHRVEETARRAEEIQAEAMMAKVIVAKSIAEGEQKVEALRYELHDARRWLGEATKETR
ncbi:hypothetical protein MUK42_07016 [Musa troglodytarum]|uniref:Uncharacterized protein n=1 Tax=Musa troglodytarum TaxID=320322 RepID=A0A9E7EJ26_9LILI|nr:hypothetical protein MUK42_07016 [Musa troglodytarum]URD78341.1 hypothetical protein MUK42_07016 [Musa troglodytarum]